MIVLLVFGFVLLRTLVKVWTERKQQKPGSKFKTRILVSLVGLTLIPVTGSIVSIEIASTVVPPPGSVRVAWTASVPQVWGAV